jgi:hypothetical protein
MLKKFLVQLVGNFEKIRGNSRFHQQEQIEHELAKERSQQATINQQERLKEQMTKRKEPSEEEILGPSDSA